MAEWLEMDKEMARKVVKGTEREMMQKVVEGDKGMEKVVERLKMGERAEGMVVEVVEQPEMDKEIVQKIIPS